MNLNKIELKEIEAAQNKKRARGGSNLLKVKSRLRKLLSSNNRPFVNKKKGSVKAQSQKPRRQSQVAQRLTLREQNSAPIKKLVICEMCSSRLQTPCG